MSSPPTTPMSQASTKFGLDSSIHLDDTKDIQRHAIIQREKQGSVSRHIFLFLLAFRVLNALIIKTFFQPDEFFQSLEPAWEIAFGAESGAWITWVRGRQTSKLRKTIAKARLRSGDIAFALRYILQSLPPYTGYRQASPGFCICLRRTAPTFW